MKKKDLIQKWLDNNLNEEELEAFKNLDAYSTFMKIDQAAKQHKAPEYLLGANYERLKVKLKKRKSIFLPKIWWSAAVIAAVIFGIYFTQFYTESIQFDTTAAEFEPVALPDASSVVLLPNSKISYNKDSWQSERNLTLEGEAYFDVAKGSSFTVVTHQGEITVLGTQFTVTARDNYFEVTCYEGLVKVTHLEYSQTLTPGKIFRALDGKVVALSADPAAVAWSQETTLFKSIPLGQVFKTIERSYGITIINKISQDALFTGAISTINLKNALNSATMPFNIDYIVSDNVVTLKKNE
jgi:transmembrane sensor